MFARVTAADRQKYQELPQELTAEQIAWKRDYIYREKIEADCESAETEESNEYQQEI